jgi:Tol biopolymer transport system component
MRTRHERLSVIVLSAVAVLTVSGLAPASAKAPAANGRIAFDRNQGEALVTINPDGSDERTLFQPGCCPRWSADGRRLVFPWLTDEGIFTSALANADGSGLQVLAPADETLHADGGVFSPDGTWLAVTAWDDTDPSRNGVYLRRAADGSEVTLVNQNPTGDRDQHGDFAPDGRRIVFLRYNAHHRGAAVFVVGTDGTGLRQVTPWGMAGCCTASWSPDGRWILFDARGNLYVVHPDGTGLKQIGLHPGGRYSAFEAAWSPDGLRIVFSMYVASRGQDDIFTARADGSDLMQVTNTPDHEGQADWGAVTP